MRKFYEEPIFDVSKIFFEDLLLDSQGNGDPEETLGEEGAGASGAWGDE